MLGDVCQACCGTGLHSISCTSCKGDGVVDQQTTLAVKVPKSVDEGMLLRIREKGHEALNGISGDLILHLKCKPDSQYKRSGFDILSDKVITYTQAVFGGITEIETINGKRKITIEPGTEHNSQIIIKGAGLSKFDVKKSQMIDEDQKGNHIVTLKITIPKTLNKQ